MYGDVFFYFVLFEFIDKVVGDEFRWFVKCEMKFRVFELFFDLR